jgi:DDE superfamily endonuclease
MSLLVGKEAPPTVESLMMHDGMASQFPQGRLISPMQASPFVTCYLCHIGGFAITSRSGAVHHKGLCLLWNPVYLLTTICRPLDYKELFNLRHSQARNVIERVFGVVKRHFRIFGIGPEYSLETQTLLISAICVLHNFIRIHDPNDFDGINLNTELERRAPRRNPEDFGRSITAVERT